MVGEAHTWIIILVIFDKGLMADGWWVMARGGLADGWWLIELLGFVGLWRY